MRRHVPERRDGRRDRAAGRRTGEPCISRVVTRDRQRRGDARAMSCAPHRHARCTRSSTAAGGYRGTPQRLIAGGSMTGRALATDAIGLTKAHELRARRVAATTCATAPGPRSAVHTLRRLRLGLPGGPAAATTAPRGARATTRSRSQRSACVDCIECGCCDYVCPSQIPLTAALPRRPGRAAHARKSRHARAAVARERYERHEQRLRDAAAEEQRDIRCSARQPRARGKRRRDARPSTGRDRDHGTMRFDVSPAPHVDRRIHRAARDVPGAAGAGAGRHRARRVVRAGPAAADSGRRHHGAGCARPPRCAGAGATRGRHCGTAACSSPRCCSRFRLPPLLPFWLTVLGTASAVLLGKHLFGGLGQNPFNPAMVGYAVLLVSFPLAMTQWPVPLDAAPRTWMDLARMTFAAFIGGDRRRPGLGRLHRRDRARFDSHRS